MPKFVENRHITVSALMDMCIKHSWYDNATVEDYDKFLNKWSSRKHLGTNHLWRMAHEIRLHSSIPSVEQYGDEDIMFTINLACMTTFAAAE